MLAQIEARAHKRWWQRPWILPLTLFTLVFLAFSIPPYLDFDPATAPIPIHPEPAWYYPVLLSHIIGGAVLMVIAIGQVWPWLRHRRPGLHRWSGRVYVYFGIPFVGVPALLIAPLNNGPLALAVNNTVWAVGWLAFVLLGYAAARRRRFAQHRAKVHHRRRPPEGLDGPQRAGRDVVPREECLDSLHRQRRHPTAARVVASYVPFRVHTPSLGNAGPALRAGRPGHGQGQDGLDGQDDDIA